MYGIQADGPSSPQVTFHVEDEAGLRAEAYGKAVEDARARAEVLAAKLGRKLGGVLRARMADGMSADTGAPEMNAYVRAMYGLRAGLTGAGTPTPLVKQAVQVEVEFALEP